ncbi:hypothetical protein ACT4TS_001171 [Enterobacter roggenkampii]
MILTMIKNLKANLVSVLLCLVVAISSYQIGSHNGYNNGYGVKDKEAKQELTTMKLEGVKKLTALQKEKQNEVNKIKTDYDSKLRNLQESTDSTIASLNSDNVRLRIQIKRTSNSANTDQCSATGQSDDYADLSEGSSRFLIGQAIKADEWIKHLQALVLELNKQLQEKNKK